MIGKSLFLLFRAKQKTDDRELDGGEQHSLSHCTREVKKGASFFPLCPLKTPPGLTQQPISKKGLKVNFQLLLGALYREGRLPVDAGCAIDATS